MDYTLSYDVSEFLDASIHEVIKTLIEAFLLVALVVFVFLQDVRSTIIPILAVPVSLVGTFFFMQLWVFAKPDHPVRFGAGHRDCGGQRHCGHRSGACQNGAFRHGATQGHRASHARN